MVNRNRNFVLYTFFVSFIACRADGIKLGKDSSSLEEILNQSQLEHKLSRSTTEAFKTSDSVLAVSHSSDKYQDIDSPFTIPVSPTTEKPHSDPTTPIPPITFPPNITTSTEAPITVPTTKPTKPTPKTPTTVTTLKPSSNGTSTETPTIKPSPITTAIPKTTVAPITTPAPSHHSRQFDGASFIGGIVLASGLMAIGFVAFKFYKARTERNYHTL